MSNAHSHEDPAIDLTIDVLGIQVPSTNETITWMDGHRTILPAVYDTTNVNVCDAVDIPIIKFLSKFPISTSSSQHVNHLPTDALFRDEILHAVGLSLSQNKPVVIRDVGTNPPPTGLSPEYLDRSFGISPHRPVCIHGMWSICRSLNV
jgi:hypothetical protein